MALLGWTSVLGQTPLQRVVSPALPAASAETNAPSSPVSGEANVSDLESRLAAARAQLAEMLAGGMTNAPAGILPQEIWTRRAGLHRLVMLYEQRLSNSSALDKAKSRRAATERESEAWTRLAEPPPYSILLTDRLREEIQAEQQKIASGDTDRSSLGQLIEENRQALSQAEESIRQINEQLESEKDPVAVARLYWRRDLENLRSQVAAASVAVFDQQLSVGREALAESRLRLSLLQRQLIMADAGAKFTQADLEKVTGQIERQGGLVERELGEYQTRQRAAQQALETAREELRLAKDRKAAEQEISRATELVAVRGAQLEAMDSAVSALRLMLESCSVERTMWEFRYAAYESRSVSQLRDSGRRLAAFKRRLGLWHDSARQQMEAAASQFQLQETRFNELPSDSPANLLERERLTALRERDRMLRRLLRSLEQLMRITERWEESLRAAERKLPFTGRVQNLFSGTRSLLGQLWTFEVFTAEDTITVDGQKITGRRSVTIGKIAMALLILLVGYWITGLATVFLERIIVKRVKIEPNQANLIRRWLRAFLVACLLVFSLVSAKIPLTVFAFAGGALAIGLGFGTQNVLKNFVSGLILLFERPFRVGDVLDVGGQKGTVTSIGLRASVLQLWDGTETLIPNSSLLENNVTNWTYSNRRVRFTVSVGVAYGSDPRRVIQLLEEVAHRHGLVEKEPKPLVLFTEFGDSTLTFELRFWVDVFRANSAQVASDLRLMIAGSFSENGIAIDYPQRDIHLHSSRPLQVQVVAAGEPQAPQVPDGATVGQKPSNLP
jgi:small-conductance mechanosensitive channel